jgi:hypothetical protein
MAALADVGDAGDRAGVLPWTTAGLVAMTAVVLAAQGAGEPGVRTVVRWTARTSLSFFCLGFAASALPSRWWLARQRRGWLASMAVSHGLHALAIAALAVLTHGVNLVERSRLLTAGGGILAYVVILAAGVRPDHRLVRLGLFWVWVAFLAAYLPRAREWPLTYGPAVALLLAALALRIAGVLRARRAGGLQEARPAGPA